MVSEDCRSELVSIQPCFVFSCTVPGPILDLSANSEVLQLTILWNIPSEPNGLIIAYLIRYSTIGEFNYTNTSATQHTLKGFRPNTVVAFSVTAYTIIGPGESVTAEANTGTVRE